MDINEAIKHSKEVAQQCNNAECSIEHIQLTKWLEELKELRKLFTLTADEVTIVEHFLTCDKNKLEQEEKSFENDIMINDLNHILTRIKQWLRQNKN